MRRMMVLAIALGASFALCAQAIAQEKAAPAAKKTAGATKPGHVIVSPADIKWGDAPPVFEPGAKMAVLQGDPSKPGLFTIRLKGPDGYKIAAHWHPTTEHLTVISGTFYLGMGDKLDEKKGTAMGPGAFGTMPAKMHHYAWMKGETELQVYGMGPFALIYVNPADDPSKAKK
jgi:hypothetical protein